MAGQQQQQKDPRFDNYVGVAVRVAEFYRDYKEGRILTTIIDHDRESGFVLIRAEVYRNPDDALPAASGHAYEYKDGGGFVQKTSYIEVCETSAVGRALANLGYKAKGEQTTARAASGGGVSKPQADTQGSRLLGKIEIVGAAIGHHRASLDKMADKKFGKKGGLAALGAGELNQVYDGLVLSEARTSFVAACREHGWDDGDIARHVKMEFKQDSVEALTLDQLRAGTEQLSTTAKPKR